MVSARVALVSTGVGWWALVSTTTHIRNEHIAHQRPSSTSVLELRTWRWRRALRPSSSSKAHRAITEHTQRRLLVLVCPAQRASERARSLERKFGVSCAWPWVGVYVGEGGCCELRLIARRLRHSMRAARLDARALALAAGLPYHARAPRRPLRGARTSCACPERV